MTIKVLDIIDNEDGTGTVIFEVDDDFKEWFKKDQNLKKWSNKRFEKWVLNTLEYSIFQEEKKLKKINL